MFLQKRRKRWYAIQDIPPQVRQEFNGKVRFVKSLETDDERVAKRRAAVCHMRWLCDIEQARTKSGDQIERDAAFWREILKDAPEPDKDVIRGLIGDEAQEMVYRAASRAGFTDEREEGFDDLPIHPAAERFFALATGKLVRLEEHLEKYLATLKTAEPKTVDMRRSTIRKFALKFPYVTDVQRKAVQGWLNEQAEDGKKPATIQRTLGELRGYWSYLQSIEVALEDALPFEKLTIPKDGKSAKKDERKPFTTAEVVKLLGAARERNDENLADLIELGMWTGARIEELCALPVTKVQDGYIEIEDAKTAAGWRQGPIHPKLKRTIARLVKGSKDGFLLSGLTANKYGKRKGAVGKRFSHLKTSLGFGRDRVFHSIRKTVATLLENAGVPEPTAADILGHDKPTMTYGLYSGGASLETKRAAIEKLRYP